jgi:class 3 adenylate cyclase
MEPQIQYAQTKDGVSIAFWTLGEGMPLVVMPNIPFSHIQLEWRMPEMRRWYERLAENRKLVRYDGRGSGLSDRDVRDYSLEALALDLEAVVERLGLEKYALAAFGDSGPVAIAHAAHHPEPVSQLVLWCTYARASDMLEGPELSGWLALMDKDWIQFTETVAHASLGWPEGDVARQIAAYLRECITQEALQAEWRASLDYDVTALLPQVRSPTLVLHRRQLRFLDVDVAKGLASRIPDARLTVLEGASVLPLGDDMEAVLEAIDEFLGEDEEAAKGEPLEASAFRTVLFTDVEGSTALTDRLGDAKAREVLREHERMVREALKAHGGSEVKALGDGFMTSFSSAVRALECAIAVQRAFAAHNKTAEEPILVRVGLNAGEPIAEEDDLYGTAVNLAARITAEGKGGEILASEAVRQIVAGKKFPFSDRGETTLRGFEDPVHVYEVSWRESE